jgi:hypothetical protein
MKNPALSADLGNPYTARVLEQDVSFLERRGAHAALSRMRPIRSRVRNGRRFSARKGTRIPGYAAFRFHCARNPALAKAMGVTLPVPQTSKTDLWNARNLE